MTGTEASSGTRTVSPDGTPIAYWTSGDGPPLVLVHGVGGDHTRWRPLLAYLEPHATVHAMDRRGRGASGDAPAYRLTREFEDVAAVVDSVAEASESPVDLYGHSYGGLCAFGAATLTANVRRLVLYEGWPLVDPGVLALSAELEDRFDTLLARGDHEAVLETLMREVVMVPDDEVRVIRAQPSWPARVAAAPTLPRELRAGAGPDGAFDAEQAAKVTVPTLLLTGEHSSDSAVASLDTVAAALPDARVVVLGGQHHLGDVLAPEAFAEQVLRFLRGTPPRSGDPSRAVSDGG